ncbi:uncharacterized protein LOC117117352 [Anneissia japonica]|uniref:uncharacterized protein LOC117117352 n=1 Tax=Anneissia japonica TaxID=1529436 RepID=UPI0014256A01|nr:uncharacterized protein LOC117117352 [Anneissia japonica]
MYTSRVFLILGAIEYYISVCKPEDQKDFGVHICLVAGDVKNETKLQWVSTASTNHTCSLIVNNITSSAIYENVLPNDTKTLEDLSIDVQYQVKIDCCSYYRHYDCNNSAGKQLQSSMLIFTQGTISSQEIKCTGGFTQHFDSQTDPLIICTVQQQKDFTLIEWQRSLDYIKCSINYKYSDREAQKELVGPFGYRMMPYTGSDLTVQLECVNITNHATSATLQVLSGVRDKVCSNDVHVKEQPDLTTNRVKKVQEESSPKKKNLNDVVLGLLMAAAFVALLIVLMVIAYRQRTNIQARRADRPLLEPSPVDEDEEGSSRMAEVSL